jgi:hypothetical protein
MGQRRRVASVGLTARLFVWLVVAENHQDTVALFGMRNRAPWILFGMRNRAFVSYLVTNRQLGPVVHSPLALAHGLATTLLERFTAHYSPLLPWFQLHALAPPTSASVRPSLSVCPCP